MCLWINNLKKIVIIQNIDPSILSGRMTQRNAAEEISCRYFSRLIMSSLSAVLFSFRSQPFASIILVTNPSIMGMPCSAEKPAPRRYTVCSSPSGISSISNSFMRQTTHSPSPYFHNNHRPIGGCLFHRPPRAATSTLSKSKRIPNTALAPRERT